MSGPGRWPSDPRRLVDVVVVVVVGVLAVADVASASNGIDGERPADALAYALVIAGSVSLYWRRTAPIAMLAFVTAVLTAMYLREYGAFLSVLGLPALYAVAAHEEHRKRRGRGENPPERHLYHSLPPQDTGIRGVING